VDDGRAEAAMIAAALHGLNGRREGVTVNVGQILAVINESQ
jgi:hypothetical protein